MAPPVRELWPRRRRGRRWVQVTWASRPTDHMKPTSSRAIAVQTTVVFLPRALRARYRAVSRVCAFQAISRTLGEVCSSL